MAGQLQSRHPWRDFDMCARCLTLIITLSLACGSFAPAPLVDRRFRDDLVDMAHRDFNFDPTKMPRAGMTSDAVTGIFGGGPARRWTYIVPFRKELGGKSFDVDSIWMYNKVIFEDITTPHFSERWTREIVLITLFFHNQTLQSYYVRHLVRESPRQKDLTGKHNTIGPDPTPESFPGENEDARRYWAQRTLEDRIRLVPHLVSDEEFRAWTEAQRSKAIKTEP